MPLSIQQTPESLTFKILVQPRSSVNKIVGLHGEALKLKLTAPPVEGAANAMVIKFLAKTLGIPKSTLEIVAGHTDRNKLVRINLVENGKVLEVKKKILSLAE